MGMKTPLHGNAEFIVDDKRVLARHHGGDGIEQCGRTDRG